MQYSSTPGTASCRTLRCPFEVPPAKEGLFRYTAGASVPSSAIRDEQRKAQPPNRRCFSLGNPMDDRPSHPTNPSTGVKRRGSCSCPHSSRQFQSLPTHPYHRSRTQCNRRRSSDPPSTLAMKGSSSTRSDVLDPSQTCSSPS